MEADSAAGIEQTRHGPSERAGGRATWLRLTRGARHGTARSERALSLVLVAAAGALLVGVWVRSFDPILGFAPAAVLSGLAGQLAVTVPAALLVGAATLLDVAAGAVLLRLMRRAPFATASDAVLGGFGGAIVVDALLLFVLGSAGLFRWPIVAAALVGLVAAGARARPIVAHRPRLGRIRPARWLLVLIVWSGPIILTLASPVVPFADVLPNHVAPAEHIRTFGDFASLATDPSPIYGSSRVFLGDTALLGTLATLSGLRATLAVAAFAIPLLGLSAIAAARSASAAFGRNAGYWALVVLPLSFTFVRLTDARDSVTALPLAALAFSLLMASPRDDAMNRPRAGSPDWMLAFALTAATLVHPLVGALAAGTVTVVSLADPARFARRAVPALAGTAVACLPQLALMVGFAPPAFVGVLAFVAAAITAVVAARVVERAMPPWASVGRGTAVGVLVGVAAVAGALVGVAIPGSLALVAQDLRLGFPVLFLGAVLIGTGIVPSRRGGRSVLVAGLAVGVAALVAVALVPGTSLTAASIRYEVPKSIGYWLPWACVPATAAALAGVWRWRGPAAIRYAVVAVALSVALLPLSGAVPNTMQASHPAADALAYDLRTAQLGYWVGYPDPRLLLDSPERELVDRLRGLEASGELGANGSVLHVAASFQPWASIPVGVFTGAIETIVSTDASRTIFTTGDRLLPMATLDRELGAGFRYVLLEPAGLPSTIRDKIVAAGYRSLLVNARGELFGRG